MVLSSRHTVYADFRCHREPGDTRWAYHLRSFAPFHKLVDCTLPALPLLHAVLVNGSDGVTALAHQD